MSLEPHSKTELVETLHQYLGIIRDAPTAICYKEFLTRDENGLERRLGIFGEVHRANSSESSIAKKVIETYEHFAVEGATKIPLSLKLISLAFIPAVLSYMIATKRTFPAASTLLKKHPSAPHHSLEDHDIQLFSFSQLCAIGITGLYASVVSPYNYWYLKKYGDPNIPGTQAYEKEMQEKESGKKGIMSRISEYSLEKNRSQRDQRMAERTAEICQQEQSGNLLVVVGRKHLDGVVENLSKKLSLTERFSYP